MQWPLGAHGSTPVRSLEGLMTSLGALGSTRTKAGSADNKPVSAGDKSESTSNHS